MYIHISCSLHCFGVVAKYTSGALNPTFHSLFRHDKDHSFLQVWAEEAHMVIMFRAFVFLNCDIGTERSITEEMQNITYLSQTMALQGLRDGLWQSCFNRVYLLFEGSLPHIFLRRSSMFFLKGTLLSCPWWHLMWLQYLDL